MEKTEIRDAATLIMVRHMTNGPAVLMGQRGANAAFMPGKFVFPGGAVDANDALISPGAPLAADQIDLLNEDSLRPPLALAGAAIRELWEETGLILGSPAAWGDAPKGWRGFAASGHRPNAAALRFVFRAITPPGRPRRFDARFFLAEATALSSDPDDFSRAEDELSHLQWVPLANARAFDLPFITQVVLAEVAGSLGQPSDQTRRKTVPFVKNKDEANLIQHLAGRHPLE